MSDTVLLTGGGGLLALNWAMMARHSSRVVLGLHQRAVCLAGVEAKRLNLESVDAIVESLASLEPALLVHTVGLTNVEACEADPARAHHVNVTLAANVARACARLSVPLVHISTDHLFSGEESLVDEEHAVAPRNVYGRTKADAEIQVLQANSDALVIRTNFFGWGPSYRRSFSDAIVYALRSGQTVTLFRDVFFTPLLVERLAGAVHELLRRNTTGIFHVSGDDRLSKCDFGYMLADEFGLDATLIKPGLLAEDAKLVQRPRDMSLSNRKVRNVLGRGLGGAKEQLTHLHDQERAGLAHEMQVL